MRPALGSGQGKTRGDWRCGVNGLGLGLFRPIAPRTGCGMVSEGRGAVRDRCVLIGTEACLSSNGGQAVEGVEVVSCGT